jgi:hypothetical protein
MVLLFKSLSTVWMAASLWSGLYNMDFTS